MFLTRHFPREGVGMPSDKPFLSLYDSHDRKLRTFVPIDEGNVRVYFCGPTVYDLIHIGNLRALLTADILVRLLRALYPKVTFVRNITDVDDKINARAKENNESIASLTERTIADFHRDISELSILPPDIEPRATHNIVEMQAIISRLIENGHAYVADGHVLFAVDQFDSYGALSGRKLEELQAGARVEIADYKRNAGDFVLWKPAEEGAPGWESPWGIGRPGWHIECSAMSHRYLGEDFDIHGGGDDLLFPHHENERAQSLCCFPGSHFAHYWVHNAMLLVDGEKMSKSLGNFFTVREIIQHHSPEALRLHLLQAHYRSVTNFTQTGLHEAKVTLDRFYRALEQAGITTALPHSVHPKVPEGFMACLCEDLNTPQAIAFMHGLADKAFAGDRQAALDLQQAGTLLGLLAHTPKEWFQAGAKIGEAEINMLIEERLAARKEKNFARADAIRQQLAEQGIILEDTANGTVWRQS